MDPSVTIITPTYNCSKFILETIYSVQQQDYPNLVHYVIDDGSTDDTQEILTKANLPANVIVSCHENIGEAATVNKGMELVKSDYFMVVNADDPLMPRAIEREVAFMQAHPEILVGYPDWRIINEEGLQTHVFITYEYSVEMMLGKHICLPGPGTIYRSKVIDLIGNRDTQFRYIADYDYFLRTGEIGKLSRIPALCASWRRRKGQASENTDRKMAEEHIRLVKKIFPSLNPGYDKIKAQSFCWAYIVAGSIARGSNGVGYGLRGIAYYPQILLNPVFLLSILKHLSFILPRIRRNAP